MAGLKPNGMAMVYGLRLDTEDNGLIVQTQFKVLEGSSFMNPLTGHYQQYLDTGLVWFCTGDIEPHGFALYDPRNLMPIDNIDPDVVELSTSDTDKIAL